MAGSLTATHVVLIVGPQRNAAGGPAAHRFEACGCTATVSLSTASTTEDQLIELAAGTQALQTHVDWTTSPLLTLHLAAGDEVTVDADVGQVGGGL